MAGGAIVISIYGNVDSLKFHVSPKEQSFPYLGIWNLINNKSDPGVKSFQGTYVIHINRLGIIFDILVISSLVVTPRCSRSENS